MGNACRGPGASVLRRPGAKGVAVRTRFAGGVPEPGDALRARARGYLLSGCSWPYGALPLYALRERPEKEPYVPSYTAISDVTSVLDAMHKRMMNATIGEHDETRAERRSGL